MMYNDRYITDLPFYMAYRFFKYTKDTNQRNPPTTLILHHLRISAMLPSKRRILAVRKKAAPSWLKCLLGVCGCC